MALHNRDQDVNTLITSDSENQSLSATSPTASSKKPSVSEDPMQSGTRESDSESSEQKDIRDKETLDDTSSQNSDSNETEEAQQQSNPSTIFMHTVIVPRGQQCEIEVDDAGDQWFCAAGIKQRTVYHSDIRYDLEQYSEFLAPQTGPHYNSTLGAGTDDKTSFHPLYDFRGKNRDDRPDSLFFLYKPSTRHHEEPPHYLVWNGRVILDYKHEAIRAFNLPLTISSKIGHEAARLEAMFRSDSRIDWKDILARILRRGVTSTKIAKIRNQLNMCLVRFRIRARLLSFSHKSGSEALETYLLTIMTAEMVAKNTTRGLGDVDPSSDEKAFIELLNLGARRNIQSRTPKRREKLRTKLARADAWAQAQIAKEVDHPVPAPSYHGPVECTAIESIVAFKLASMSQRRRDGGLVHEGGFTLMSAAPYYEFDNEGMWDFFGMPTSIIDEDANDPYGLLGSQVTTKAHSRLVEILLEPARLQYRLLTLVSTGLDTYKPIFTTNPEDSYWGQLQALQAAFERDWTEAGHRGTPPVLYGLKRLDYGSITWNSDQVPTLNIVTHSIDSCTRTFAAWQRLQADTLRTRLREQQDDFEADETDGEGSDGGEEGDIVMTDEREDDEDDVEMEESGGAEVIEEDESEEDESEEDESEEDESEEGEEL